MVREMDVVVIPNRRSAATELMLPVKLIEGVALGLPVLAPRLQAITRYFSDEQLFYFEPDDPESLAAAIVEAYVDREARDCRAERASHFCQQFAWASHSLVLRQTYDALTSACATTHQERRVAL